MKFLIIGVGNIGLRHIQGLTNLSLKNLEFYLYDTNNFYKERFNDEIKNLKKNYIIKDIKNLKEISDILFEITIISTTASNRIEILYKINKTILTKYILLEKPICQSMYELKDLKQLSNENIFVNFPRRYCVWHTEIKKKLIKKYSNKIFKFKILGGMIGLACNACHFVDLINFWTNQYPTKVLINNLDKWYKSKRDGFYEVDGNLEVKFNNNISLLIKSINEKKTLEIEVVDINNNQILFIDYATGIAKFEDGDIIRGKMKYQSESTHLLLGLIKRNDKNLCNLEKAIKLYEPLIEGLINHWNKEFNKNDDKIMIT